MVLIFGGAYQGKLTYALERFGLTEGDVFRCGCEDASVPGGRRIINDLDKWILALTKADADVTGEVKRFISENEGAIVICNDISCGVVPEDPVHRKWRETTGRAMSELAGVSHEVVRLFCGIATKLKDYN